MNCEKDITKINLVASFESFCILVNLFMYLVSYHLKCFHEENMNLNCAIWNVKYSKEGLKYTVLLMFLCKIFCLFVDILY